MTHEFTPKIDEVLIRRFGDMAPTIFAQSQLIQYLNNKTRSATRGSKSRSSFANLYAIYVLAEDYLAKNYHKAGDYSKYEGAMFTKLFKRQRELPFGSKLQNHALNHRLNEEFKKYFPTCEYVPILRNAEDNRYWINTALTKIVVAKTTYDLTEALIDIINVYIETKKQSFDLFLESCTKLSEVIKQAPEAAEPFIMELLAPNKDARLFEIVSFAILKYFYHDTIVYFGFSETNLTKEHLRLFKTGRTNANDGGIDFVMKPLGRFFQVTETLDLKKYFLDIDKIERFPISFVIKSEESVEDLRNKLESRAKQQYRVDAIVKNYMACIEEVINIPVLKERFRTSQKNGYLKNIMDEIVKQSRVEFNYSEETGIPEEDEAGTVDEEESLI